MTRIPEALARVRRAYRDTVLSTTHYREDYDEPLAANITKSSARSSPPRSRKTASSRRLSRTPSLEASQTAATDRTAYQKTLETEENALQDAKRRLRTLTHVRDQTSTPQSFTALIDAHARVENLRADCATIIENRQATLAGRPHRLRHRLRHRLHDYLYQDRDWTYPVLADALDCRTQIQAIEDEIVQTITRHPKPTHAQRTDSTVPTTLQTSTPIGEGVFTYAPRGSH